MLTDQMLEFELSSEIFANPVLPVSECEEMTKLLVMKYGKFLDGRFFKVRTGMQGTLIYAEIILQNENASFYYPVQARCEYDSTQASKKDTTLFLLDYIEQYLFEFFQDSEILLPLNWEEYEASGKSLQMKGQIYDLAAEYAADRLLNGGSDLLQ